MLCVSTLEALTDSMSENFSEGTYCTWCIYGTIGKACSRSRTRALTDRHSCCWLGEKCVYSVQPDGGSSTLTSWTFTSVPVWQRLTLHNFQTSNLNSEKQEFLSFLYLICCYRCYVRTYWAASSSCWTAWTGRASSIINVDVFVFPTPEVVWLRNVFKCWAGATCPSIPSNLGCG